MGTNALAGRRRKWLAGIAGAFLLAVLGALGSNAGDRIWQALPFTGGGGEVEPEIELTSSILSTNLTRADFNRTFKGDGAAAAAKSDGIGLVLEVRASSAASVPCRLRWTIVDVSTTFAVDEPGFANQEAADVTKTAERCPFLTRIWVPLPSPSFPVIKVRLEALDEDGLPLDTTETPVLERTANVDG